MRILMGNNPLSLLAGSETWTLTLAKEFKRLGHDVTCYSPHLGIIAAKLEAEGIHCVSSIEGASGVSRFSPVFEEKKNNYDVIICNHYEITKYLHSRFPACAGRSALPIIATVHGILHKGENGEIWPEHPVTDFPVNYTAVSEEVKELLLAEYGIDSVVIRNFFDLKRFKKKEKIKEKPETILVNSNYWGKDEPLNKIIKEVANHYGAKFVGIGANFVPTYEVDEILRDVDIVFGMGRSVLEGVCAGCLGVVHGRWGTGGVLAPDTVEDISRVNFSGRNSGGEFWTAKKIIAEIDKYYNQENIDAMRSYMEKEHNVDLAAQKYLEIANKVRG